MSNSTATAKPTCTVCGKSFKSREHSPQINPNAHEFQRSA